jgi:heterokaryon incompatibility protein (HET)
MSNSMDQPRLSPRNGQNFEESLAQSHLTTEKYVYQPFPSHDHIRLLELLPGSGADIIRCLLHIESLENAEDTYAAISYAWGDPNDTVHITCEDRILEVTASISDALYHIRHNRKSTMLWADAICINQNDNTEKNHQVTRMRNVYENAKEVLIWLGKDTEGIAEDCFSLIRETLEYLSAQWRIHGNIRDIPILTQASPPFSDKFRWKKLSRLLAQSWFARTWVAQEAAVAKHCELLWGERSLNFAELCELSSWYIRRQDVSNFISQSGIAIVGSLFALCCTYDNPKSWRNSKPLIAEASVKSTHRPKTFLEILSIGRQKQASKDVDRVYAFLGNPLARHGAHAGLLVEPDYGKSMSEVYFDVAFKILSYQREAPHLLSFVDHRYAGDLECASIAREREFHSWIPRWDTGWRVYVYGLPHYWYRAGALNRSFSARVQQDKSLLLPTLLFDKVVWTSRTLKEQNVKLDPDKWDEYTKNLNTTFIDDLSSKVQGFSQEYSPLPSSESPFTDGSSFKEAFSLTLVQMLPALDPQTLDLLQHHRNFEAYLQAARVLVNPQSVHDSSEIPNEAVGGDPHAIIADLVYSHNRRFAITASGRFALVHMIAQPEDVCCVSPGMKVPLILRPREDGRYSLIGESYIHGVMSGEIMHQLDRGEIALKDIIIV